MFKEDSSYVVDRFIGEAKLRTYMIIPERMWMNDAEEKDGLYIDYRVEIDITRS